MEEKPSLHIVHAATYSSLAMVAQALVTLALPYAGISLPPVVLAAIISVLVGGGTVALHLLGIALPGTPADGGKAALMGALRTLLLDEGPALLARLTQPSAVPVPSPAPPPAAPLPSGASLVPVPGSDRLAPAAGAPGPEPDLAWSGPVGPRGPLGAGHGPVPPTTAPQG